ncbi:hypothetical protein ACFQ3Z_24050 [Streptomyces nogalater]
MMTVTVVAVLLVLIAVGAVLIHRLNAQHEERIADFHYSDALPGIGRRPRRRRRGGGHDRSAGPHRDGDRGGRRLRPGRGDGKAGSSSTGEGQHPGGDHADAPEDPADGDGRGTCGCPEGRATP